MAYNKFKIEHLKEKLHLKVFNEYWLHTTLDQFPEDTILESLLSDAPKLFLEHSFQLETLCPKSN